MTLTARAQVTINAKLEQALDLGTAVGTINKGYGPNFATGVGLNQADKLWHDQRTLAASATEDLDVAGVLFDMLGGAFTLARLKGLIVSAAAGNTNNVNVSRPGTNGVPLFLAAGDAIPIRPGGVLGWFAPDATAVVVTTGTADLITVTNSAGVSAVTYDVVIIGASA